MDAREAPPPRERSVRTASRSFGTSRSIGRPVSRETVAELGVYYNVPYIRYAQLALGHRAEVSVRSAELVRRHRAGLTRYLLRVWVPMHTTLLTYVCDHHVGVLPSRLNRLEQGGYDDNRQ